MPFALRMLNYTCSLITCLSLSSHALSLDLGDDMDLGPSSEEGMRYVFERGGKVNPRWSTSMLKGSIEGKPRPLYLAGFNREGVIIAALRDDDGLGDLASAGGLIDFGQLVGEASSVFGVYSPETDLENHVGKFLYQQGKPDVLIHIERFEELIQPRDLRQREGQQRYTVTIHGRLEVTGGQSASFSSDAQVILRDAVAQGTSATPPSMEFVASWTLNGSELGWTGSHAGPIEWRLYKQGFGDTAEEADRLFEAGLRDQLLRD
ncbi:MAG: hypothetical protein EA401_04355 [Planctomycetota bacterium]|nr:MAG: hypothetical protein EA401_04355 [Planctomycetota bacterium]